METIFTALRQAFEQYVVGVVNRAAEVAVGAAVEKIVDQKIADLLERLPMSVLDQVGGQVAGEI